MVTVSDKKSDTLYQFRVRAILPDGQLGNASISDWISTLNGKESKNRKVL
jgi:hypothetical protein